MLAGLELTCFFLQIIIKLYSDLAGQPKDWGSLFSNKTDIMQFVSCHVYVFLNHSLGLAFGVGHL